MAFCIQCGSELTKGDDFCQVCGAGVLLTSFRPAPVVASTVPYRTPLEIGRTGTSLSAMAAVVGILALLVWFAVSPYITLWRLQSAVASDDADTLILLVAWDSLRSSIKSELGTLLWASVREEEVSAGWYALVGGLGAVATDTLVDQLVTSENVTNLLNGRAPDFSDLGIVGNAVARGMLAALQSDGGIPPDWKERVSERLSVSNGYASWNVFELRFAVTQAGRSTPQPLGRLVLTRRGLSWVVSRAHFAEDVLAVAQGGVHELSTENVAHQRRSRTQSSEMDNSAPSATLAETPPQQATDEEHQRVAAAEESARVATADADQSALDRAKTAGAELRTLFGMIACDTVASRCHIGSSGAWFKPAETTGKRLLGSCPDGTACRVDGWVLPTQEVVVVDKAGPL